MSRTPANVLAERLRAIGSHIDDQVAANTTTGTTLREAAEWLSVTDDLLAACQAAMRIEALWGPAAACSMLIPEEAEALEAMRENFKAAIAKVGATP